MAYAEPLLLAILKRWYKKANTGINDEINDNFETSIMASIKAPNLYADRSFDKGLEYH
jgi:hypothetical protein